MKKKLLYVATIVLLVALGVGLVTAVFDGAAVGGAVGVRLPDGDKLIFQAQANIYRISTVPVKILNEL